MGLFKWLVFNIIGLIYSIPFTLYILYEIIFHPRKFFSKSTNWSSTQLPNPTKTPVHSTMIQTSKDVFIHTIKTFETSSSHKDRDIILFVHGFPEYWGSWRHQIDFLYDKGYDVAAIDMRGYGLSSKPTDANDYAVEHLAADIACVMQTIGNGEKIILVAHDWGGAVCWQVAHRYQYLIEKLVIACAPHPRCFISNMTLKQFFKSWYMFFFLVPIIPELCFSCNDYGIFDEMFLHGKPLGVCRPGSITIEDVKHYKREFARPGALTAALNYYRRSLRAMAYGSSSSTSTTKSKGNNNGDDEITRPTPMPQRTIAVPTLVVWAAQDGALGNELLRGLDRYVENVRMETFENCSHWIQQDAPDDFNDVLLEFIELEK